MNKKAKFAVKTLKEYALENQTTARGTKIIPPLEMRWLPKEDITTDECMASAYAELN